MQHKKYIQQYFNRSALTYNENNFIQNQIGSTLIQNIHKKNFNSILDLGCGTGVITEKIAASFTYEFFHAIDIADAMLVQAQKRLKAYRVKLSNNDFENISGYFSNVDLIFSNMALQWSTHLSCTFMLLNSLLSTNGILAFSVPLVGTFAELKKEQRNSFHTTEEYLTLLCHHGFSILFTKEEKIIIEFDHWLSAFQSIKGSGANYLFKKNHHTLGRKSARYEHLIRKQKVSLSYQIGYFIAQK